MKKAFLFFVFFSFSMTPAFSQSGDEKAIREVLEAQRQAWNKGDVETYMNGYWHSDSLMFIGKSGITYGWGNTLANYKKGYPDTVAMGHLDFDILQIKKLSGSCYFIVGKWHLTRSQGNAQGHFTLLFRNIKNQWVIVADHSS